MSHYAKRMSLLSARIFGEITRPTHARSQRVVGFFAEKPKEQRTQINTDYYPQHIQLTRLMYQLRQLGLYRDEHRDFKEEMIRVRALRGKVKPKKGEGKRAMKRKS